MNHFTQFQFVSGALSKFQQTTLSTQPNYETTRKANVTDLLDGGDGSACL